MPLVIKIITVLSLGYAGLGALQAAPVAASKTAPAPNGIELPADYKHWQVVSTSHRTDKHSLRVILGNSIAIHAIQSKQTQPWPDGAILAKLVWQEKQHPNWAEAVVAGDLQHVEFMLKDSKKYATTAGWGFARWLGMAQKPFGTDAGFAQECLACHTAVQANDFVFTLPAPLP